MHSLRPIIASDAGVCEAAQQVGWAKRTLAPGSCCDGAECVGPQPLEEDIMARKEEEVAPEQVHADMWRRQRLQCASSWSEHLGVIDAAAEVRLCSRRCVSLPFSLPRLHCETTH